MGLVKNEADEDTLDEALRTEARIEELPTDDSDSDFEDVEDKKKKKQKVKRPNQALSKPPGFSQDELPLYLREATLGLFHAEHETPTTTSQQKVTAECLPFLLGRETEGLPINKYGIQGLARQRCVEFLQAHLDDLPADYIAADASRPWFFYWVMSGLGWLGEDATPYKQRLVETLRPLQNRTGGFGGGHGQLSHSASSYAAVLALACVDGLDMVDRPAMWRWLGACKQPDGGFQMARNAEEDVRGAYCAMTIITLLNLPLELPPDAPARKAGLTSFLDRLGAWIGRCQTFEGGIGGAPANEAHGAYAFCALACLCLLDTPRRSIPQHLDVERLAHWLAARQTQPEGGFQGRQEKLVDACYSHWVGGCWDLLAAAMQPPTTTGGAEAANDLSVPRSPGLWNRAALIRYLLTACQPKGARRGGFRDKPGTRPDGYHTCYALAGLSHAQNHYHYDDSSTATDEHGTDKGRLQAAFRWRAQAPSAGELAEWSIEEGDRVAFVHPVFVIPMDAVERARVRFEGVGI